MSDSTNLCLSCLQCCNGTLIGFVQLESDEIKKLNGLLAIEEDHNGAGVFLQPCNKLCADGCAIYEQRPKQCRSFNCGLLNSVEQKEIDFESAVEVINLVKQKRIGIEKKLEQLSIELKSESFYFKMVELKKVLKRMESEAPLTPNHLALATDLKQLGSILPSKFGISAF